MENIDNKSNETIFFDTYAFFEILKDSPSYYPYVSARAITTKLNLFELYANLLKDYNEKDAGLILEKYSSFIIEFDKEIIKEAGKMKFLFGRNISMTDCIGYIVAKKAGVKFLTGDKQFEFLPDVEFVK